MQIFFCGGYSRMAEDFLHHADVDTLLHEKRACCVSGIVKTAGSNCSRNEDCSPLAPVVAAFDRRPIDGGENKVVVGPS